MDRLIQIAKALALLAVVPVAVFLCIFLHQLTATTAEFQGTAKNLPTKIDDRLASMQSDVLKKIDTVQDKLTTQVTTLANQSDNRLASVQSDLVGAVNTQLGEANKNINDQLSATNKSINTLVTAYADIPNQVSARYNRDFDPYFNCKQNSLCLQGQASDTLFAIRDASRSTSTTMAGVRDTLPGIENNIASITTNAQSVTNTFATSIPTITTNFTSITANIDRLTKPKWYDRLLGYGLNGAILYRNLNPVTSLTVTGAQVVSSGAATLIPHK